MATLQGYLHKHSGGRKADSTGLARRFSTSGKGERRFFVLDSHNGVLRYYKKEGAHESKEFVCRSALLSVLDKEGAFCIESRERVLSLKADTDAERSAWVQALLGAGAINHPLGANLAAQPIAAAPGAERSPNAAATPPAPPAPPSRTLVPVPPGLSAGDRFNVETPSGETFSVTVPAGAAERIEVVVPSRCGSISETAQAHDAPPAAAAVGGAAGAAGGSSDYTLCRRLEVPFEREAARSPLHNPLHNPLRSPLPPALAHSLFYRPLPPADRAARLHAGDP